MEDNWIFFDGNEDCDDDCRGWNPKEGNRCFCGNRRVSWSCLEKKCKCNTDEEYYSCPNSYAEAD